MSSLEECFKIEASENFTEIENTLLWELNNEFNFFIRNTGKGILYLN